MCADRRDDFKKGIKDKTQQRQAENLGLRKQKREDKLRHRRVAVKLDTAATFEQLFAKYDKHALLSGSLDQLKLLNQLLFLATKDQLDKHVDALLFEETKPVILTLLLALCRNSEHKQFESTHLAITCLLNLTGTRSSFELQCAKALVDGGFLQTVETHLTLFLKGMHPTMNVPMHSQLWEVVLNIIITCPEARDVVLESSLMGFRGQCEGASEAVFIRDLRFIATQAQELLPVIMSVISGIYEMNDDELPPWLFTMATWPYVIETLCDVQSIPYHEMDDSVRITFSCTTTIIMSVLQGLKTQEEGAIRLIGLAGPVRLMQKLGQLHVCANLINQVRIVKIFVHISGLPLKDSEFQISMEKAGCIPVMMRTLQSNEERLRQQGFLWVGNHMSDGVTYVHHMIQAGVMDALIASVRRDKEHVRRNAVYALMTMFSACDQDRKTNMRYSEMANGIMFTLVTKVGLFRWLTPFVGLVGGEDVTTDILTVMADALRWNKKVTMKAIETADAPERVSLLLDQISSFKGSQYTNLYNAAIVVDDLINDREPEVDRLQFMETQEEGFIAPGIFQGGFKF